MAGRQPDSRRRDASGGGAKGRPCRLYCTHTTFAESVLEDASGEAGAKVLGYSVRASSLDERTEVRNIFRTIERFLSYELPCDTPAADKEHLDAASAPRRLFFVPSCGQFQIFGQICYRSHDTAGRPGSYFADVLVAPLDEHVPVSARDCIQLWAAGADGAISHSREWWCDSREMAEAQESAGDHRPFISAKTGTDFASGIRRAEVPIICDRSLLAFLNCQTPAEFADQDSAGVIASRWHAIDRDSRRLLLARLLRATIGILKEKERNRARLVVAVEPSVAALLFYGIFRMLPDIIVRQAPGVSFSTFEPYPERAAMNLVATTFQRQEASTADLSSELRCFWCNTFRRDPSGGLRYSRDVTDPVGDYTAWCMQHACAGEQGLAEVDAMFARLANVAPEVSADALDLVATADRDVREFLDGRSFASRPPATSSPAATEDANAYRGSLFSTLVEERFRNRKSLPRDVLQKALEWLPHLNWEEEGGVQEIMRKVVRIMATSSNGKQTPEIPRAMPDALAIEWFVAKANADGQLPEDLAKFIKEAKKNPRESTDFFRRFLRRLRNTAAAPSVPAEILRRSDFIKHGKSILAVAFQELDPDPDIAAGIAQNVLSRFLDAPNPKERWDYLVEHGDVAKRFGSNFVFAPALKTKLDSMFNGLPWTPVAVAGTRLGPDIRKSRVAALKSWANATSDPKTNVANVQAWETFFEKLAILIQAAKGETSLRGRDLHQAINAAICSLRIVAGDTDFFNPKPPEKLQKLFADAAATQPLSVEESSTLHNWVKNAFDWSARRSKSKPTLLTRYAIPAAGALAATAFILVAIVWVLKPGHSPAEAPPLTEKDIGFRCTREGDKLVLEWNELVWNHCSRVELKRADGTSHKSFKKGSCSFECGESDIASFNGAVVLEIHTKPPISTHLELPEADRDTKK